MNLIKSALLAEQLQQDNLPIVSEVFPFHVFDSFDKTGTRSRVFDQKTTAMTMILSALQSDKSLKNAVMIYEQIHQKKADRIRKNTPSSKSSSQRGLKSKLSPISSNTSAYSQARSRLPVECLTSIFNETRILPESKERWHGYQTFCTDGTYLQLQDTAELRAFFDVKRDDPSFRSPYPESLCQLMLNHDTGGFHSFRLHNRHVSELELCYDLLNDLPEKSLVLGDDLYNCYCLLAAALSRGVDMIVPGKRKRIYTVESVIGPGDERVWLKKSSTSKWLSPTETIPNKLLVRRIQFVSPITGKEMVIYTTILNAEISAQDIVAKYFTRWQIELSIREIKTIMNMDVIRGKTKDMVEKEVLSSIIAYNMIRRVINQSIEKTGFSPSSDLIRAVFKKDPDLHIDKLGRIYHHWSPGRMGYAATQNTHLQDSETPT